MIMEAPPRLDIVIPVYNEGANILSTLQSFARAVKTPLRVQSATTATMTTRCRLSRVIARRWWDLLSYSYATAGAVFTVQW